MSFLISPYRFAVAGGAIPFEYRATVGGGASSSIHTISVDIGSEDANRLVVLDLGWIGSSGGNRTLDACTINGVTATRAAGGTQNGRGCGMAYAVVPTGTTVTVVLTFSNTVDTLACSSYRLIPASATPVDTVAIAGTTSVILSDVDMVTGGAVITCAIDANDAGSLTLTNNGVDTPATDYNANIGSASDFASGSFQPTETISTNDLTWAGTSGATMNAIALSFA